MKRLVRLLMAAVVAAGLGAVYSAQEQPPAMSRAVSQKDKPLELLIRPGQRLLVVEKDQSPPHIIQPYPSSIGQLEWFAKRAPTALIIRVENLVPRLTPSRDWIDSTVHATVEKVLKFTSAVVSPGQAIQFKQDGGEMVVRGTLIRAVLPYADLFEPRQRYLVFAEPSKDNDGTYLIEPMMSFLLAGPEPRLTPLAREGNVLSERGVTLASALERIEATVKAKP